ncbi:MAG: insulinase family protein [Clostridia bacterium]|nr:insulinase family protein [Clostridia bacterium]
MKIIESLNVKEKVYIEKLENGMTVIVLPKENTTKKYILWGTNYGSIDNKFIVPGEENETEVPDGVAHFLEHKMFEQENGTNSLDVLSSLGVEANAYTTNDHTAYLFGCTDNFYEALDELMDYVQHPYFTDENVEKEKGIIGQEIMMYDDYPDWIVYMNALDCMYKVHPVKLDITGTIDTISKIDKDILYKCYNTFYNPSNMTLVVCGDFKSEEIIEEIKKRLIDAKKQGEIKRIYTKEPKEINKPFAKQNMQVSNPLFIIGVKDERNLEEDIVKKHIAVEILLNMLLGKSSKLYKELYEEGNILAEPSLDYEFAKEYAHIMITGQSKNPEKVMEKLKGKIKDLKEKGLDEVHFTRIKKKIYGDYITEYNDVGSIARMFLADSFKGINSFDYLEKYNEVSKEYTEQILKDVFNEDKMVLSIVENGNQ